MRKLYIMVLACVGVLAFAAQPAQAATVALNVEDGFSHWKARGIVEVPSGYTQSYLSSDREYVSFRRPLSSKCVVQASASTRTDSTSGGAPNPAESVRLFLSFYVNKGGLGGGSMRNPTGTAGGRAISQNGAWGAQKTVDNSKKSAAVGMAFYSAAAKYKLLYITLGINTQLLGSSGCSNAQILGQSGVVNRMVSVFKVS